MANQVNLSTENNLSDQKVAGVSLVKTDDARLADARTPTAHGHSAADLTSGTLPDARLPERLGIVAQAITDWNDAIESGKVMATGAANAPGSGWFIGNITQHNPIYVTQEVWQFTDLATSPDMWRRQSYDSAGVRAWRAWERVWQTQTDLDARYKNVGELVADGELPARLYGYTSAAYVVNPDDCTASGFYSINGSTYVLPVTGVSEGCQLWVSAWDVSFVEQIMMGHNSGIMAKRRKASGVWGAWKIVVDTEIGDARYMDIGGVNLLSGGGPARTVGRYYSIVVYPFLTPIVGQSVTISYEAKATIAANISGPYPYQSKGVSIYDSGNTYFTTSWQKFVHKTTAYDWGYVAGYSLGEVSWYDPINAGNALSFRNIKVERGRVATDWTPSLGESAPIPFYYSSASDARPFVGGYVEWRGPGNVVPTNAVDGDTWVATS